MGFDSDRAPVAPLSVPRLLYVGDAPVEASFGGSALIYRLLCEYPRERLWVMQGREGDVLRRLPGVRYQAGRPVRVVPSRWPGLHAVLSLARAHAVAASVATEVRAYAPQAVITVAHESGWITAWRVAQRLRVPLHLICHDDWEPTLALPRAFRGGARRSFAQAYAYATTRLCVSPRMAAHYERQIGVAGTVLYPGRAKDVPTFERTPEPRHSDEFTVAYAGSVHAAYAPALRALAAALAPIGGRLLLISSLTASVADALGLAGPTVRRKEPMDAAALVPYLRAHADALFLVGTDVGLNTRIAFPSKLVDYTAAGLPVIICAPDESAPAYWAKENPGAAILLGVDDRSGLREAVVALSKDPEKRRALGAQSRVAGERFDYALVRDAFLRAVAPALSPAPLGRPDCRPLQCI